MRGSTFLVMEPQFEELSRAIGDDVERRMGEAEARIKKHIDDFETRLEHRMQVHFDRMEDSVQRAGEGYGGTLESIDRRLGRLEKQSHSKLSVHENVLRNHRARITKLEERS